MPDSPAREDHDSPWKEALGNRFAEFLALLFPEIHARIDWSRAPEFLDTELQQLVADAELGRRYADKLVKVWAADGAQTWVLVHVEVQGAPERAFARRMFVYHYRLFDRYGVDVVSLGVLADARADFRPDSYRHGRWGCRHEFHFPVVKLLDWLLRWDELEASDNPFAVVVMAQLRAKLSRDPVERQRWKLKLVRGLYDRGHGRAVIIELFRVIDWMIRLPEGLEREFLDTVYADEERNKMPYVTSAERFGIEKGVKQGIEKGLEQGRLEGEAAVLLRQIRRKFGPEASAAAEARIGAADAETLLEWSERILSAETVDQVFD